MVGIGLGETVGLSDGDGDGDCGGSVDGDGDGGVAPVQGTPLTAKSLGLGLLPVQVPLKPMSAVAPVARLPFHGMFRAVTLAPDWLHSADHPWVICWPAGKVKVSVQPFSGSPRFLMVMLAVKPPARTRWTSRWWCR